MLIIALVRHLELPEWNIADCSVKEAVGKVCILEALHRDAVFLIQLLGDPPGNTVQLHAVELRVIHAFGNKPHKVADAAGGLYQSGVFDTGEYEPGYEMFPIYKDFRGFVSSRRSFWFMGIMKLSARTMYAYENAARLLGKSCSDMVYRVRI